MAPQMAQRWREELSARLSEPTAEIADDGSRTTSRPDLFQQDAVAVDRDRGGRRWRAVRPYRDPSHRAQPLCTHGGHAGNGVSGAAVESGEPHDGHVHPHRLAIRRPAIPGA